MNIFSPEIAGNQLSKQHGLELPFVGGAYKTPSVDLNTQTCINCLIISDKHGGKSPNALIGRPGLSLFMDLEGNEVRGILEENDFLYVVKDTIFYVIDKYLNVNQQGILNTASGLVSMISNGTQIMISDTFYKYYYDQEDDIFQQIVDPTYVVPVVLAYQDGYGVYTKPNSTQWFITDLYDFSDIDPLDFASANGTPDYLMAVISTHQELWLFSRSTVEIWYDVGNIDFPFERRQSLLLQYGCIAPRSVVKIDNGSAVWLTTNKDGQTLVVMVEGYVPRIITDDNAVAYALNQYSDEALAGAFAISMQINNNILYILTIPDVDRTWTYNLSVNEWFEWRSTLNNVLPAAYPTRQGRWLANCYAVFQNQILVGDFQSGKIYSVSLDYDDDNGIPIWGERTTYHYHSENATLFISQLDLICQRGVGINSTNIAYSNPEVMLTISRDGGHVFGQEMRRELGAQGNYNVNVRWGRLGSGKDFVLKFRWVTTNKIALLGIRINGEKGSV